MKSIEQPWIEAGYKIFSKEGPSGLKVDQIARMVGISRSSFYHHFADLEVFQEKLLKYHLERAHQAAQQVKLCKVVDPDFLLKLVEEKEYVLVNRQLRIHRDNPDYKVGFETAIAIVNMENMRIWREYLSMQTRPDTALHTFNIIADIFFQRITEENFNFEWLKAFAKEILHFVHELKDKDK